MWVLEKRWGDRVLDERGGSPGQYTETKRGGKKKGRTHGVVVGKEKVNAGALVKRRRKEGGKVSSWTTEGQEEERENGPWKGEGGERKKASPAKTE